MLLTLLSLGGKMLEPGQYHSNWNYGPCIPKWAKQAAGWPTSTHRCPQRADRNVWVFALIFTGTHCASTTKQNLALPFLYPHLHHSRLYKSKWKLGKGQETIAHLPQTRTYSPVDAGACSIVHIPTLQASVTRFYIVTWINSSLTHWLTSLSAKFLLFQLLHSFHVCTFASWKIPKRFQHLKGKSPVAVCWKFG